MSLDSWLRPLPKTQPLEHRKPPGFTPAELWHAYRMRWARRRLLWRALRKRHQLVLRSDKTSRIGPATILAFSTVRNEAQRLPFFLAHHRALGVGHFLIVDNDSTDGSTNFLCGQPDVSLWHTTHSYRMSRFGMDWLTNLQMRYGHRHWCLTLDADEALIYPHWPDRDLSALTEWLDRSGQCSFGALMLEMYPQGPIGAQSYRTGQDPAEVLQWFDPAPYRAQYQPRLQSLWVQGGVRERMFFADEPERAPTLNKVPLIRWDRRYAYVNSTHSALPTRLNHVDDQPDAGRTTGVLLHSKFLPSVIDKSAEEKSRREHFANSALYDHYYDSLIANPDLWHPQSQRYTGWQQLEDLGLMSRGDWA